MEFIYIWYLYFLKFLFVLEMDERVGMDKIDKIGLFLLLNCYYLRMVIFIFFLEV